jgi:hypothetical protein
MRSNFPLSSEQINNKLLLSYENLVYLLGQSLPDKPYCSGLYDRLQTSGEYLATTTSGILVGDSPRIIDTLKFDYYYRKHFGQIRN